MLIGCGAEQEPATLQQVDWRNGPYGVGCGDSEPVELVDGEAAVLDENHAQLRALGYAQLDGLPGDEAVLEQSCVSDVHRLSVWTGSEDGPRLVGPVPVPDGLAGVSDWAIDKGVLCVLFTAGDDPGAGAETRAVRVAADDVNVLPNLFCEVDGVPSVPAQGFGEG